MHISSIKISNLRNHEKSVAEFGKGLNIIHGLNGSGKTTLLEAISIGSMTKTFLPTQDQALVKHGEQAYYINMQAINDINSDYWIKVLYEPGKRKSINSNFGDNLTPKDVIGEVPLVVLTPDFKPITFGSPQERRSFIDRLLSQISKRYMSDMMDLKKCLKQRNSLLNDAKKDRRFDLSLIDAWTDVLLKTGTEIVNKRNKFVEGFKHIFQDFYRKVAGGKEEVKLKYLPNGFEENEIEALEPEQIRHKYEELSTKVKEEELRRGTTAFGPQKDELLILINGAVARETASQGQHKSLLIALKFAEFIYLLEKRKETPVILLDDIFSELDAKRKAFTLELILENKAQTFITTTDASEIKLESSNMKANYLFVDNGIVFKNT